MHRKQIILMIIGCSLPLVALAALFLFQVELSKPILFALILFCPLSHLLMLGGLGQGKQLDAHHAQEADHG